MPSKTTGPQRAARYRKRLADAGLRQVNVICPEDRIEELRGIARSWSDQQIRTFVVQANRQGRQHDLPLGVSADAD